MNCVSRNDDALFVGQMPLRGGRDLLQLSGDWLLRLRHNPFYDFLKSRALTWMGSANDRKERFDETAK